MHEQNVWNLIREQLSAETREILHTAGLLASELGGSLYLVGGIVRDLLLHRENLDLDLVTEGDAISLAHRMADAVGGKVTEHPRFRTATVKWEGQSVDFVTARSETYTRPGALPSVKPGDLSVDLARRDFTINSMAVSLSEKNYGKLIDPFDGCADLTKGLIRILHDGSFTDDATRMWRAIRYEQRLGFTIEPKTLELLKRNLSMLDTISRDRIRHELELVLEEETPEKALRRAGELGVLHNLHPDLRADDWLDGKFREIRDRYQPGEPSWEMYLALLVYRLEPEIIREFGTDLKLRKRQIELLHDICKVKEKAEVIDNYPLQPSAVYLNLQGISPKALDVALTAEASNVVRKNIALYLNELRQVKISLTGADLRSMGIAEGPLIKLILEYILDAKLDGELQTREDEIRRVREEFLEGHLKG